LSGRHLNLEFRTAQFAGLQKSKKKLAESQKMALLQYAIATLFPTQAFHFLRNTLESLQPTHQTKTWALIFFFALNLCSAVTVPKRKTDINTSPSHVKLSTAFRFQ